MTHVDDLLAEMRAYYDARATEHDEEVSDCMASVYDTIVQLMRQAALNGRVLELAAGTGHFTAPLSTMAEHVDALDGSPAMLRVLAQRRLPNVARICRDIFTWRPPRRWDAIFFNNWLAHVPPTHFEAFWSTLDRALKPGGRVVFVDVTSQEAGKEARVFQEAGVPLVTREAAGRSFNVIKLWWDPEELLARLAELGWTGSATPVGDDLGRGFAFYNVGRVDD